MATHRAIPLALAHSFPGQEIYPVHVTVVTDDLEACSEDVLTRPPISSNAVSYTNYPLNLRAEIVLFEPRAVGPNLSSELVETVMASDPIKILIVDDDEQVLIELERLLESEGYSTATAWSVREALDLSDKLRFDLLLVDEHLHGLDSVALLRELQMKQPDAFPLLMRSTRNQKFRAAANAVCKWEHTEVKARIRQHLAA